MSKNFLSINANYNDFSTLPSSEIDEFLLSNDPVILSKLYGFCQKNDDLLLVTGFGGTGKTNVTNHLLNYIDKDVYLFKYNCSVSSTLDDILLSIWNRFILYSQNTDLVYRYMNITSYYERIINCFSEPSRNILLVLYNFENIQKENIKSILDFIYEIAPNKNVKIIITSKTFDTTNISENIIYTKVILKALSRLNFEKYVQSYNLKSTPRIIDELYKITRGYYLYTVISVKILLQKELSINDYLVAYTNSGMSFDKFIAKAFISMLPKEVNNLLNYFALIRHPINSDVLDYFNNFDKFSIDYLVSNKFIKHSNGLYVLNEFFREMTISEMDEDILHKIHAEIVDFYNNQLPLKPNERFILLSRVTMRQEKAFHQNFIQNTATINENNQEIELPNEKKLDNENIISLAKKYYDEYKYSESLKLYLYILENKLLDVNDIYLKLAELYSLLGNIKYSLHYYQQLLINTHTDSCDIGIIKLKIAELYYQSYKNNDAINILYEIISESINTQIVIKAYTLLGNIYISLSAKDKAYELYNKAITLIKRENISDVSELYFKFAILADEKDEIDIAIKYYSLCISISDDTDKYKSLSYSNLGDFYLDINDYDNSLKNFMLAYELDTQNNNFYGIYYTASSIAKIMLKIKNKDAKSYLVEAKKSAVITGDIFAMANSGLHLGDYYTNENLYKEALKEYSEVKTLVKDTFSVYNIKKIDARINDIKQIIGNEKFCEYFSE